MKYPVRDQPLTPICEHECGPLIKEIINSSSVNIQIGGGIRSMDSIDTYVDLGAARLVLGTIAF